MEYFIFYLMEIRTIFSTMFVYLTGVVVFFANEQGLV